MSYKMFQDMLNSFNIDVHSCAIRFDPFKFRRGEGFNFHVSCFIGVNKREDAFFIERHNAALLVKKLKALEKQPLNISSCFHRMWSLRRENKFMRGTTSVEKVENPPGVNAYSTKRKRKASEKLQRSMYVVSMLSCPFRQFACLLLFEDQCLNGFAN